MRAWCRRCKAERDVPFQGTDPGQFGCEGCGSMLVSTLAKDRKPLERRTKLTSVSRKPRERIWTPARAKVEQEGICRLARLEDCSGRLESAHVIGRDRDQFPPLDAAVIEEWLHADARGRWLVAPARTVPLCRHHHTAYDRGEIGLLGRLFVGEELQAVVDSSTEGTMESGIELARRRIDAPACAETGGGDAKPVLAVPVGIPTRTTKAAADPPEPEPPLVQRLWTTRDEARGERDDARRGLRQAATMVRRARAALEGRIEL